MKGHFTKKHGANRLFCHFKKFPSFEDLKIKQQ